jgi:ABC-type sugar transport system ATPase subunit
VGKLPIGERQLVEIARTLQQQSDIIIMDEPNSALNERESMQLFEIIRRLRDQGITVIYVSHRLEEVFAIADRISVIRDGHYQGTWRTPETSIPQVIAAMIGRRLEETFPERGPVPADAPIVLNVNDLCRGDQLGPISFQVRAGEILGFAGLEGSGVEDVFHILFGLHRSTSGQITYHDLDKRKEERMQQINSPVEAIRRGWGLIPASRREQGLMMGWSITQNTTLVILNRLLSRLGLIDAAKDRGTTRQYIQRLNIATDSIDKKVINLSGGNQQKVVIAKWLATGPRILILNDPTRGVDVGAKSEVYRLCHQLAQEGLALLFTSSEADEILGLCNRILVLYRGRVIREFQRGEAIKADLMHWIAGGHEL